MFTSATRPSTLFLALVFSFLFSSNPVWVLRDELMNVRPLKIPKGQDIGIKQTNKQTATTNLFPFSISCCFKQALTLICYAVYYYLFKL